MDIRLKKLNNILLTKIVLFIIAVICIASSITMSINLIKIYDNNIINILQENSYYESQMFEDDITNIIKLFEKYFKDNYSVFNGNGPELRHKLETQYRGLKYNYLNIISTKSSIKESFKTCPAYFLYDQKLGAEVHPKEIANNSNYDYMIRKSVENSGSNKFIYLGFTYEFLNPRIEKWENKKSIIIQNIYIIIALLAVFLITLIFLAIFCGRKSYRDKKLHLNALDRIYNDINILLCIVLIIEWSKLIKDIYYSNYYFIEIVAVETLITSTVGLLLLTSIFKHFKNKTLIKHTLIYTLVNKIKVLIQKVYNQGNTGKKVTLIVVGYSIALLLTSHIFPVTICIAVWLVLKKVRDYNDIKEVVKEVENGKYNCRIDIPSQGELGELATSINSINNGLHQAVENKLKSERLKTELISNLSHDIRTPLTSIITYVDLLKIENDKDKSKKYIGILEKKSQRLKTLTDDLFELSKASSGNIKVNFDKIDVVSLINQGLGELHERIEERGYDFKINHSKDNIYVKADGMLLWRVIENLLNNIIKYTSEGSRVYIDIFDLDGFVNMSFKNISAYELNIPVDELMERFIRGDNSRSSEGSGIGLSIAKSLTELQEGRFYIDIDGDLFKATIQIPKFIND
ncbi:HAMP domain-containing sensor histidine kinase [Vallitalea guaymasensis]|uniref:HAMP domain-containing sensor histidine kinase n=1 Tax=Vallitalea guaymasensis TaxID=1185412 RepID=UPI00272D9D4A|nr:HAMP domain-containing sensor histidine kinase [Vallitalea guaymasensis]